MKTPYLWLLFAALCFTNNVVAANFNYVFYDYKNCKEFSADGEYDTGDINYEAWKRKAAKINANSSHSDWWIYQTAPEVFGLCRHTYARSGAPLEFICHAESDKRFPLAGATYRAVFDKAGNTLRLNCVSGCRSETPKVLFDARFEFDDSEENVKKDPNYIVLQNAERQFLLTCPRSK